MRIDTISAAMLDSYVMRSDTVIIDVRSAIEYRKCHICGAVNVPLAELDNYFPDREKILVIYCERGATSIVAATNMCRRGYIAKSVVGGISAYRGNNLCRN